MKTPCKPQVTKCSQLNINNRITRGYIIYTDNTCHKTMMPDLQKVKYCNFILWNAYLITFVMYWAIPRIKIFGLYPSLKHMILIVWQAEIYIPMFPVIFCFSYYILYSWKKWIKSVSKSIILPADTLVHKLETHVNVEQPAQCLQWSLLNQYIWV